MKTFRQALLALVVLMSGATLVQAQDGERYCCYAGDGSRCCGHICYATESSCAAL